MQKNFFTGRSQLYDNNSYTSHDGVSVSINIGDIYIENNITIEYQTPETNIGYNYDDNLKPLFKKVI